MFQTKKYILLFLTTMLMITACGSNVDNESAIQTAVAETVAAQHSNILTNTQIPPTTLIPTQTPYQIQTSLPTPFSTVIATLPNQNSKAECAKASLTGENTDVLPDGTILKPGTQFTKTWFITNTSTCVWDTSYKIIFWSGDTLGGGYVYNLPQVTGPGQTVPISLVLTAPSTDGAYRSEWKLQTPDNINFGVGMYDSPFYAEIQVSASDKPQQYGVTALNAYYVREPKTGCPANSLYTFYVTVTTNGPTEFSYFWSQKDGNDSKVKHVEIESATNTTFTREWKFGRANSQGAKWVAFTITEPVEKTIKLDFEFVCP